MNDDFQDELISAYLDDELSPEERSLVEKRLATDDEARRMVDELRQLRDDIQSLPRHRLESDFAQRVLRSAEREMLIGRSDKEKNSTLRRRDRNERRRLNVRGLLWAGVSIACAVIIGIEFSKPEREVAGVDQSESAPESDVAEETYKIDHQAVEASEPPASSVAFDESAGSVASPEEDAAAPAAPSAELKRLKPQPRKLAASPGKTGGQPQGAGGSEGYFGKSIAGDEASDRKADRTRSGLRRQRRTPRDRQDSTGLKKPADSSTKDSLSASGPVYVVTVDLTSDLASQQAWFATLKQHQVLDEDDQHQLGLAGNERPVLEDQVYNVSLPQSRAVALIAALRTQRDHFGVKVHTSSLPGFAADSKKPKELEEKARSERNSALPSAEPDNSKLRRWAMTKDKSDKSNRSDPNQVRDGKAAKRKKSADVAETDPKAVLPRRSQTAQREPRVMLLFVVRAEKPETAAAAEATPAESDTD